MIHSCIKILQKLNVYYTKSIMDSGSMFHITVSVYVCIRDRLGVGNVIQLL